MTLIQRILLPTDFSELATHAAPYATSLARMYAADLHVVHVITPVPATIPAPAMGRVGPALSVPEEIAGREESLVRFARDHCGDSGRPTTSTLLHGAPESAICQYVRDHTIDLVVIGTHARGVVARIFLGSVSKMILENAGCPVLMVPLLHPEEATNAPGASPNTAGRDERREE